ncbi:hypothetical protein BI330_11235 [Mycobacterium sp. CBMA 623]|nr:MULTISPECIES: hypothetical protein [unclassified Mycobacteroides]MUM16951.1 hypothetical protein [Mycobacteroides sp. CBMA 326]
MRAGILIGTAFVTFGVIASAAPAVAEPCPPEVCSVPGLPGLPSGGIPFMPSSMSDLPPQLSRYEGWGDPQPDWWNQGEDLGPAPAPAQLPPGLVEQGLRWMDGANGAPPMYPPPA